jgi:hypothetical protein
VDADIFSGITFTLILSLPIFCLPVYLVFMPDGAPAAHDFFGIKRLMPRFGAKDN